MALGIVRSEDEIEKMLDDSIERAAVTSHYPGMTYEEGVLAVLDWLLGRRDESPLED